MRVTSRPPTGDDHNADGVGSRRRLVRYFDVTVTVR
jgi:hypothetical protein